MRASGARLREPRLAVWPQPASKMEDRTTAVMITDFMGFPSR
jgi:hypothetical protein